jgi:hypothetical protein
LIGQGLLQVPPGADAEFGEHLAQVPFDSAGACFAWRGDLVIGWATGIRDRGSNLLLDGRV